MDNNSLIPKESLELLKLVYKDLASPGVSQVGIALSRTIQFIALPTLFLDWANKREPIGSDTIDIFGHRM